MHNIDIAALSETRVLGENVIEEPGGGYTFFLKGKPEGEKRYHGVGLPSDPNWYHSWKVNFRLV